MSFPIHAAAAAFPAISDDELRDLANDIERHGQLVPIEIYQGQVIDGRHRQEACKMAKVEPEYVDVDLGGRTPEEYVWSLNGTRRHLTASQRAAIAADLVPHYREQAKERLKTSTGGAEPRPVAKMPQAEKHGENGKKGRATEHAASVAGVSERHVRDAAKLKETDPELHDQVKQGKKSLSAAKREVAQRNGTGKPKPNCHKLVDDLRPLIGKLIRGIDDVARANGGQGKCHKQAHDACQVVIDCLKEMRKGQQ